MTDVDGKRRRLALFYAWLALGWAMIGVVVVLSLTTVPIPSGLFDYQDKAEHLLAYFVMMGWFAQLYGRPRHILWLALLITMGVGLEFLQSLTPNRVFEYADMAANSVGALVAWGLGRTRFADLLAWFETRVLGMTTSDEQNPPTETGTGA